MEKFFVLSGITFNVKSNTEFLLSIACDDYKNIYYLDGVKIGEGCDNIIHTETSKYAVETNTTFEVWLKLEDDFSNSSDMLFEFILGYLENSKEFEGKKITLTKIED